MNELYLHDKILEFVRTFKIVKESQICTFFRDWNKYLVENTIRDLKVINRLHEHPNGLVSVVRNLHHPIDAFMPTIYSLEVLCQLTSSEVVFFESQRFPVNLIFFTTDNQTYDVSYFDRANWQSKYALIPENRRRCIPPEEEDHAIHVAAIHDTELIKHIKPLGFSFYMVLDPSGDGGELYAAD